MTITRAHAQDAIALAKDMRQAGARYDLGSVSRSATDCTGMAAILYNTCNGATGDNRFRWRFWTGSPASVFDNLGFTRLLGPAGSFQIGYSTKAEMQQFVPGTSAGHCGATVMGVNIEMSLSNGLRVGGAARGANNPMFKHQRHIPIEGAMLAAGILEPPVVRYPGTPLKRGSTNTDAVKWVQGRLRWYGNQITSDGDFGTHTEGLVKKFQANRRADVPGADQSGTVGPITWAMLAAPKFSHVLKRGNVCKHVKQLKVALNRLGNDLDPDNGTFGPDTEGVVIRWQERHGQTVTKKVNGLTWWWMHVPVGHHTPDLDG
jgi:Putative peptidoglycan binding domain